MVRFDQKVISIISKKYNLSFVVLFGSRIKKQGSFKNDYDIAVLLKKNKIDGDKEIKLICEFSQILKTDDIDLVLLNFAHPLLQYEVAMEGDLLYENVRGSFDEFCWRAVQKWSDNKKFNDLNMEYVKNYL